MKNRLLFASSGEPIAFVEGEHVFALDGVWTGFTPDGTSLYDATGRYIGMFLNDGRIAIDATRAAPKDLPPPEAVAPTKLPSSIPHRPPFPKLPSPYKEAILIGADGTTRPLTFVATQIAVLSLAIFGTVFLVWQLTSGTESTNRLIAKLEPILLGFVAFGMSVALAAIFIIVRGLTRRQIRILLVGTKQQRAEICQLLSDVGLSKFRLSQVESEATPLTPADPVIRTYADNRRFDYVLIANLMEPKTGTFKNWNFGTEVGLPPRSKICDIPTLVEKSQGRILPSHPSTTSLFSSLAEKPIAANSLLRRGLDILVALVLIFFAAPLMAVTALMIRIESRGPVMYRQERIGIHGHKFYIIKFRSMRTDVERDGKPKWASGYDSRVTRVGSIIRRLRIDELPQLFNVLRGDMSVVGPRPERPFFVEQLEQELPNYRWRHLVKPGITGWAQVRYQYGATVEDSHEKLAYDLYYIKNRTLPLDLLILLETVGTVITGRGAR